MVAHLYEHWSVSKVGARAHLVPAEGGPRVLCGKWISFDGRQVGSAQLPGCQVCERIAERIEALDRRERAG